MPEISGKHFANIHLLDSADPALVPAPDDPEAPGLPRPGAAQADLQQLPRHVRWCRCRCGQTRWRAPTAGTGAGASFSWPDGSRDWAQTNTECDIYLVHTSALQIYLDIY